MWTCRIAFGCLFALATVVTPGRDCEADTPAVTAEAKRTITKVPAHLSAFYAKHTSVAGFPIVSSAKVLDYAVFEAAYLIENMLARRPDVLKALRDNGVRFAIMARDEFTTDIPEHSDLKPKEHWDRRARGLGPTKQRPAVSCGEENLLCFPGDPYSTENILVHEFAHAIHLMGLNSIDPKFDPRLKETYEQAMREKLWDGKYASRNKEEYWAEGVQSYFDTNRPPDNDHNHVRTREALKKHDPRLAALIDDALGSVPWRYQRPDARVEKGHLQGYDPRQAPRFQWPKNAESKAKIP